MPLAGGLNALAIQFATRTLGFGLPVQRLSAFITLVLVSGCIWIAGLGEQNHRTPSPGKGDQWEVISQPTGRALYVVIERDGIYLGRHRVDFDIAQLTVNQLIKDLSIRTLILEGTDLANYGEFARFYAGLNRSSLEYVDVATWSLPVGTRRPMTGLFKGCGCGSMDVENPDLYN